MIPDNHIKKGRSYPIGATVEDGGVNFCIFSQNAHFVELLLFDSPESQKPSQVILLDPTENKTFYYWHIFVEGIGHGQAYAYRMYGPYQPEKGLYFDSSKVLIDPYAKYIHPGPNYSRKAAQRPGNNSPYSMRSVVVDNSQYDWEGDLPCTHDYKKMVIYEMHVGGFTKSPSSGIEDSKKGTYAGVIEKIPYLKELGVTTVELLPVFQFDKFDAPQGRINFWGYSPINFFAPHQEYAREGKNPVDEFRDMVKALHKAGIEVILDVVYNHTAEVHESGPTLNFRGIENNAYYMTDNQNNYTYKNYSGCGNTLNANHSIVRRMIVDSLKYWVTEMHVDGFRFDLASVLSRDEDGVPLKNPPILWAIESNPVLAGAKMIAEAWDAAGLYQVGNFIGDKFAEWNGKYRDVMRRFVKGDEFIIHDFMDCIAGSKRVFEQSIINNTEKRNPNRSINFITCHDGFTLNDLVSYNYKHNEHNGEDNRDGSNDNLSWNCGVEGHTENSDINHLRDKQVKNFMTLLFLSQGTPMILMGDEIRRTKGGNNNTYCHDNELNWFDWNEVEKNRGLFEFTKKLIKANLTFRVFQKEEFWDEHSLTHPPTISWHGVDFDNPDLGDRSHAIAYMLTDQEAGEQIYVMVNSYWEALEFEMPLCTLDDNSKTFHRVIDTDLPSPRDILPLDEAKEIKEESYIVAPRSIAVFIAL
ncbi:glycogen debranching protein GlgX [Sediminitomix flava]|uniref:Glycogen operon protein n=1 Tax=Sediminitomix flava TaxID=379075 RepID=A0A315ZF53_SEDFL|nr:glycogen debranching protein GlgX [Sediminitomix flava]PWJ43790.1 glycogen operon protein [Sediminitomix flava]